MKRELRVSVIICSLRAGPELKDCLISIYAQEYPAYEIIVVSSVKPESSSNKIRWVRDPGNIGLSAARNMGIAEASGDIVAFIDDDAKAEPCWLSEIIKGFSDPMVGGVGGGILIGDSDVVWSLYNVVSPFGLVRNRLKPHNEKRGSIVTIVGTNMAFRRDVLNTVGGFDPYYTFYLEDVEICIRIMRAGWKIKVLSASTVRHYLLESSHRKNIYQKVARSRAYFTTQNFSSSIPPPIIIIFIFFGLLYDIGSVTIRIEGYLKRGNIIRGIFEFLYEIRSCIIECFYGFRDGFIFQR